MGNIGEPSHTGDGVQGGLSGRVIGLVGKDRRSTAG